MECGNEKNSNTEKIKKIMTIPEIPKIFLRL